MAKCSTKMYLKQNKVWLTKIKKDCEKWLWLMRMVSTMSSVSTTFELLQQQHPVLKV